MSRSEAHRTELHGGWLMVGRIAWVTIALPTLGLVAWGFTEMLRTTAPVAGPPQIYEVLGTLGLSHRAGALVLLLPSVTFLTLTALVLFWRRSNDALALLTSVMLITAFAGVGGRSLLVLKGVHPQTTAVVRVVEVMGVLSLVLVLCLFPNGRFVPRWTRLLPVVGLVAAVALPDAFELIQFGEPTDLYPGWRRSLVLLIFFAIFIAVVIGQVQRYRRHSGPAERLQTKWVGFGLICVTAVVVQGQIVALALGERGLTWLAWSVIASSVPLVFVEAALVIAITRYRLYEIDRIISRTATYAIVTALLAGLYALVTLVVPSVFLGTVNTPDWLIAGTTLLVAALFRPVRNSVQRSVERRFNRSRFDAARTIEAFASSLRRHIDLDTMGAELVEVASRTMQPAHTSLWMR